MIINRLRSLHPVLKLAVGAFVLATAPATRASGLGDAVVNSYLGENLRVAVSLTGTSMEDANCVVIKASSDSIPALRSPSYVVVGEGARLALEVRTARPVNDPVVGLRVSLGCTSLVTRDYVLLLDPRPSTMLAETSATGTVAAAGPSAATVSNPPVATAVTGSASTVPATPPAPRRRSGTHTPASAAPGPTVAASAPANSRHKAKRPSAGAPEKPPGRDRLVLVQNLDSPALSLDEVVSTGAAAGELDADQQRELRDDRARLRAYLQGKDPAVVPTERELTLQKQLADLSRNLGSVRNQINEVRERNQQLEAQRVPPYLSWGLGGVAVIAVLVALYLVRQTRRAQAAPGAGAWWEQPALADPAPVPSPAPARRAEPAPETTLPARVPEARRAASPLAPAVPPSDVIPLENVPHTVPRIPVPAPTDIVVEEVSGPAAVHAAAQAIGLPPAPQAAAPAESQSRPATRTDAFGKTTSIPFGVVSVIGSLDEQIDPRPPAVPVTLDLELDLPALGAPAPGKAAPASVGPAPIAPSPAPAETVPAASTRDTLDAPTLPATFERLSGTTPGGEDSQVIEGGNIPVGTGSSLSLEEQEDILSRQPADLRERLLRYALAVTQVEALAADAPKAIALLREYVLRDEHAPTLMWLELLELYKKIGKRPVYEALGEHFARRFHRNMVAWDDGVQVRATQQGLSAMPELAARVRQDFGTEQGLETLRAILCDRDQPDAVVFNVPLQRELLEMCRAYPRTPPH